MSVIRRNITRTILNTTETTKETSTLQSDALVFVVTTSDFFYVGFKGRFSTRYFEMGTVNSNSTTLTVEYWDGSAWTAVDDLIDQTEGFTQSGFISWVNKTDWEKSTQTPVDTDIELYWVRMSVSADLSAGTTLQAVENLYSDDNLLRAYYPEIVSDTRYLPTGRTNFLDQHRAAKDLIVLRFNQFRGIEEEQIIDINTVAIAAVHAVAWLILNPIAMDDETRALSERAFREMEREIDKVKLKFDADLDGKIDTSDQGYIVPTLVNRR